jgi:hypothetical protein
MAGFENETPASHLPGSSPKSPEKPNAIPFPLGKHLSGTPRKLSAKEGSEILAKAWQRLSDPVFVQILQTVLQLNDPGEIRQALLALETVRRAGLGLARG